MDETTKQAVIRQQMRETKKKQLADKTIDNSGALDVTNKQIVSLWLEILTLSHQTKHRAWPQQWLPAATNKAPTTPMIK